MSVKSEYPDKNVQNVYDYLDAIDLKKIPNKIQ